MSKKIRITFGETEVYAELNNTVTAGKLIKALPLEVEGNIWGDEIYFEVPVIAVSENPQSIVEKGDIAYWPPSSALCIFFGPTPISGPDEIRPTGEVNVIGKISGKSDAFKKYKTGDIIKIGSVS